MRNLLFLFVFAGFAQTTFACGGYAGTAPKWKVGILAAGHYPNGGYGFHPSFLPGVQVSRITGNYEWRLGVENTRTKWSQPTPGILWYADGEDRRTTVRAGVQRNFRLGSRWTIYGAGDLAYRNTYSEGNVSGCFGPIGISQRRMNGGGLMTSLGVDFRLAERVSVFAEYRAEAFLYNVREDFYYESPDVKPNRNRYSQFDFGFGNIGHIGVSLSI